VLAAEFLDARYPTQRAQLRSAWKKEMEASCTNSDDFQGPRALAARDRVADAMVE
jgi:hypothetical protein